MITLRLEVSDAAAAKLLQNSLERYMNNASAVAAYSAEHLGSSFHDEDDPCGIIEDAHICVEDTAHLKSTADGLWQAARNAVLRAHYAETSQPLPPQVPFVLR